MYPSRQPPRGQAAYQHVDRTALAAGAQPHALIAIMFDELLLALDAMPLALERRDYAQFAHRQTRAISVLHALESALDHDAAPALAGSLLRCYRQARSLLKTGATAHDMAPVAEARSIIALLADAWRNVAPA